MRRIVSSTIAVAASALVLAATATPASAAIGKVTVFETEFQEVTEFRNPDGCHKLPLMAHVLVNDTNDTVRIYGDPFCLTPSLTVQPGYGSHVVAGSGSFSA
ncbi:hypothetical protein [Amycolatopsis nigrescens]|uniref:hypothetical protein n=1 Tax=Amycolatopsis nigrescens TaxID=381445 RepID=UPI000476E54F|nr:hypothetical protein [Amycolatopsis nigrescens]